MELDRRSLFQAFVGLFLIVFVEVVRLPVQALLDAAHQQIYGLLVRFLLDLVLNTGEAGLILPAVIFEGFAELAAPAVQDVRDEALRLFPVKRLALLWLVHGGIFHRGSESRNRFGRSDPGLTVPTRIDTYRTAGESVGKNYNYEAGDGIVVGIANLRIGAIALALALCLIPTVAPANPEITVNLPSNSSMRFVRIEPGSFLMGTSEKHRQQMDKMAVRGDGGFISTLYSEREIPQHRVTLTKGFFLGKYEVTQKQWLAVMGAKAEKELKKWRDSPEEWQGDRRPAKLQSSE